MKVADLDVERVLAVPAEAYPVLLVDANLRNVVGSGDLLELIAWRRARVVDAGRGMNRDELREGRPGIRSSRFDALHELKSVSASWSMNDPITPKHIP